MNSSWWRAIPRALGEGARDKETQALLPLRGKVLNSMSKDSRTVLANKELQAIATAIGVDPHSSEEKADLSALRYGKIIVMTDADVDGGHIQALLLTLLHACAAPRRGRPPLRRAAAALQGRGAEPGQAQARAAHLLPGR